VTTGEEAAYFGKGGEPFVRNFERVPRKGKGGGKSKGDRLSGKEKKRNRDITSPGGKRKR